MRTTKRCRWIKQGPGALAVDMMQEDITGTCDIGRIDQFLVDRWKEIWRNREDEGGVGLEDKFIGGIPKPGGYASCFGNKCEGFMGSVALTKRGA